MRQDDRAPFTAALDHARAAAYPDGEYVAQESFMRARDIRRIAEEAGVAAGVTVLDLCCGVAGPGRLIAAETGCDYVGVDSSAGALRIARERCKGLPCTFVRSRIPPVPSVPADVVLLLATMLAFADKDRLLASIAQRLCSGGRFGCTVEVGMPLTAREHMAMPDSDTVRLIPYDDLTAAIRRAGLRIRWTHDATATRCASARALLDAYVADAEHIAEVVGRRAVDDLITAHRLWVAWLAGGRVRDIEVVAWKP